jgi:predicted HAD superfamily Cof-like phosphohydrolase
VTVVREFHRAFGQPAPASPPIRPDVETLRLRLRLISEEYKEVKAELESLIHSTDPDVTVDLFRKLLKELADLRYVVEGCAVTFGLPIDAAYAEVHRSNMSKLGPDGKPIYREDGKVLKGDRYTPADMHQFIPDIHTATYEEAAP